MSNSWRLHGHTSFIFNWSCPLPTSDTSTLFMSDAFTHSTKLVEKHCMFVQIVHFEVNSMTNWYESTCTFLYILYLYIYIFHALCASLEESFILIISEITNEKIIKDCSHRWMLFFIPSTHVTEHIITIRWGNYSYSWYTHSRTETHSDIEKPLLLDRHFLSLPISF